MSESETKTTTEPSSLEGTMMAYCISKPGEKGKVIQVPIPTPPKNYALIKVLYAGVCNTDLEIIQGYMGFTGVIGHEFIGQVIETNTSNVELQSTYTDQYVCGDINLPCMKDNCNVCSRSSDVMNGSTPSSTTATKDEAFYMKRNHCPNRTVLGILNHNGTFSEYITLPISNLHLVPKNILLQNEKDRGLMKSVFSEPLAAAFRIVEQNLISYGANSNSNSSSSSSNSNTYPDKVAILGDGKLGLMIAEVLGREYLKHLGHMKKKQHESSSGAVPVVQPPMLFGKHESKMSLVKGCGVEMTLVQNIFQQNDYDDSNDNNSNTNTNSNININNTDPIPQYANQYDVVIDATGNPNGLLLASKLCRPMGKIVLKSTCAVGKEFNTAPFVIDELFVIGSRCGPIHVALDLLALEEEEKKEEDQEKEEQDEKVALPPINVEKYITKVFSLKNAEEAIEFAARKSTMKVLIDCTIPLTEE